MKIISKRFIYYNEDNSIVDLSYIKRIYPDGRFICFKEKDGSDFRWSFKGRKDCIEAYKSLAELVSKKLETETKKIEQYNEYKG